MSITFHVDADTSLRELTAMAAALASLQGCKIKDATMPELGNRAPEPYPTTPLPEVLKPEPQPQDIREAVIEHDNTVQKDPNASNPIGSQDGGAGTGPTVLSIPDGVELDVDGLPWDGRIHSSNRQKVTGGTWRLRRNGDPATVAAVTAELRAALGAPRPLYERMRDAVSALEAPTEPQAPPPPVSEGMAPPPPVEDVAPPPPGASDAVGTASGAVVAASASNPLDGIGPLLQRITADKAAGTLTDATITTVLQGLGLTSMRDLMVRPDLIASVEMALYS